MTGDTFHLSRTFLAFHDKIVRTLSMQIFFRYCFWQLFPPYPKKYPCGNCSAYHPYPHTTAACQQEFISSDRLLIYLWFCFFRFASCSDLLCRSSYMSWIQSLTGAFHISFLLGIFFIKLFEFIPISLAIRISSSPSLHFRFASSQSSCLYAIFYLFSPKPLYSFRWVS